VEKQVTNLLTEATRLGKSNNCGDMTQAEHKLTEVLRLNPEREKTVMASLQKVREGMLACFEGTGSLQMAIQISKRQPVTLHVWIKNTSGRVRHANPNYFTLITKSGESHSYSSDSFEYAKPFPAVELQPGTQASGIVVFDTYAAPKTLIYQELIGDRVSRDFPSSRGRNKTPA